MSAEALIANLLRVANEDLEGARLLAAASNRNAAYLCEQSAEKLIKAVLTAEAKHAGIKHQLDAMVDMVPDENPLKPLLRAVEHLGAYATAYRYPGPSGRVPRAPGSSELQAAIADVAAALGAAARAFGVDLSTSGTPAANPKPPR